MRPVIQGLLFTAFCILYIASLVATLILFLVQFINEFKIYYELYHGTLLTLVIMNAILLFFVTLLSPNPSRAKWLVALVIGLLLPLYFIIWPWAGEEIEMYQARHDPESFYYQGPVGL